MRRRGKGLAITTMALGLAVLVGAGIAAKDRIVEEWWLYKVEWGSQEEQIQGVRRLGEMRSRRAIPLLLDLSGFPANREGAELHMLSNAALVAIGPPAVPALISQLKAEYYGTRVDAGITLGYLGPVATDAIPALTEALEDESDLVRTIAAHALVQIQRTSAAAGEAR